MPTVYNWTIHRSGPGLRISGVIAHLDSTIDPAGRLTGIETVEISAAGDLVARRRGAAVAILSPRRYLCHN